MAGVWNGTPGSAGPESPEGPADRRTVLADAAIRVVVQTGLRGLTHRAVDAAAGVPAGSASNHFRTRAALVEAVADRIMARELRVAAYTIAPDGDIDEFIAGMARFAVALIADHADLARARFTLIAAWPERFVPGHLHYLAAVEQALAAGGLVDSGRTAVALSDYLDGMILHAVTVRMGEVPDVDELTGRLLRLVGRI